MAIPIYNNRTLDWGFIMFTTMVGLIWSTFSFLCYKNMEALGTYGSNIDMIYYAIFLPPAMIILFAFIIYVSYTYVSFLYACLDKIFNGENLDIFEMIFMFSVWTNWLDA